MFKTYRSSKTFVKDSRIGKGLFAIDNIEKNEIVAIKGGHLVTSIEVNKLDKEVGDFSLQISDDIFLSAKSKNEIDDFTILINHSCDPNIGMDGRIAFVAMRDISKGEELCLDYAMIISYDYRLVCNCGSINCRGIITGNDWKKPELQKRYDKYFSLFIYNKMHNIVKDESFKITN